MTANYLAIETCSESCSVALSVAGEISHRDLVNAQGHAQNLLPMIEQLLAEQGLSVKDLSVIGFCHGPGAFTGVRIGTAVAQGLSVAHDIPLVTVSSLQVLAQSAYRLSKAEYVLSALDARMGEVYFGAYQLNQGLMQATVSEQVIAPESIDFSEFKDLAWHTAGIGWSNYPSLLTSAEAHFQKLKVNSILYPHAIDIIGYISDTVGQGQTCQASQVEPVYLRDKVVN